jgi:hypothetical protein
MNTRIFLNWCRAIASGSFLIAGVLFFYDAKTVKTDELYYLCIIVSSMFTVGGSLLMFLPYEKE